LILPARRSFLLLLWIAVIVGSVYAAPGLNAQTFDATNLRQPTALAATWLVRDGDDPAYAQPGFDDSQWIRFDPTTSLHKAIFSSDPRVVWYRLHVKVSPSQSGLALEEWNISSAFEVYVNGRRVVQTGKVAPFAAYTYAARLLERIPDREIATGDLVIALRVHISRTEWGDQFAGFYATNLILGQEDALRDHIWLTVIGENAINWIISLSGLGLGIVALALFTAQRQHREYVWIFLQFLAPVCVLPLKIVETFHNVPANLDLLREPFEIAGFYFAILMYLALLRVRFGWWTRALAAVAILGSILSDVGQAHGSISRVAAIVALFPLLFLIAGVIPVLLIVHLRRGNREAGILLIPAILQSLSIYIQVGLFFMSQVPAFQATSNRAGVLLFRLPAGPFQLSLDQFGRLLYVLSLAVIIVLRSTRISRQQALLEGEMAAAREVQGVILPDESERVSGFTVESVYEPAQQVGGDFFQILPAGEGGLLLVMGDVAGKGLPAAMLVSLLVGAIRGVAAFTREPAELLANLNERLIGRVDAGFATALAAHIAVDGRVTVANAGHLSPYLDGLEVELAGALPLGIKSRVRYETKHFHLGPGSRLTFYSDGVVEAQNQRGELFGFERGRELSMQPAAAIAAAAKNFGQRDDITVVAITRESAIANAA
jgi:hypothetical protein